MRTDVPTWLDYFYSMAKVAASRSKDPNTQVGAVIVKDRHIIATGYNGFAPGVLETEKRWSRPEKYERVIHAEINAIAAAAKSGHATNGAILVCTLFPCSNCCRLIIAAGIKRVVAPKPEHHGWEEEHAASKKMFKEAKVKVAWVPQDVE